MLLCELTQPVNRKELAKALEPFLNFISSGNPVSRKQIANKLRKSLAMYGVGEVEINSSEHVDRGDMNMNAAYDPYDDENELDPFYIELIFSPEDKTIEFDEQGVENIKDRVLDALEHEMIHMKQYRNRNFVKQKKYKTNSQDPNVKKSKEYLGNDDEIEAFAKNISTELIRKAGKDGAIELLRMASKTAGFKDEMGYLLSPNLLGYLAMWGFDTTHPVIKKLLKKVYFFIKNS